MDRLAVSRTAWFRFGPLTVTIPLPRARRVK